MEERAHVVVAVIYNSTKDKVLISKRSKHQHLAGYWEFPGGKVEANEDARSALKRELFEELGIVINNVKAFKKISYDYPDKSVFLDIWKVNTWAEAPRGCEGQEIRWVELNDLNNYKFPDANKHIVQSIQLSSYYLISKDFYSDYSDLFSIAEQCFSAGLRLFQLRLKIERNQFFHDVVNSLSELAHTYNANFILNGTATDLEKYRVDGVHLKAHELKAYESRPISEDYILGASCHNVDELIKAIKLDVDYAFISPVLATSSHPDAVPLGWEKFCALQQEVSFPVYALGGMKPCNLELAQSYGAHGIAMIGAIWDAELRSGLVGLFD